MAGPLPVFLEATGGEPLLSPVSCLLVRLHPVEDRRGEPVALAGPRPVLLILEELFAPKQVHDGHDVPDAHHKPVVLPDLVVVILEVGGYVRVLFAVLRRLDLLDRSLRGFRPLWEVLDGSLLLKEPLRR